MRAILYDTVDSTNEAAKRLIHAGDLKEPAYLLAREQTAGKGTRGRTWASPRDAGIYLTVIEFPRETADVDVTDFTRAAGIAAARTLSEVGVHVELKPLNDLFVADCKLGGILVETILKAGSIQAMFSGIGMNLCRADRDVAPGATKPISLEEVMSPEQFSELDKERLVASLVARVARWNRAVIDGPISYVHETWTSYHVTPNDRLL